MIDYARDIFVQQKSFYFHPFLSFYLVTVVATILVHDPGPKISTIPNTDTLVATAAGPTRYIYKDRYARVI